MNAAMAEVPVIDVEPLLSGVGPVDKVAVLLREACCEAGFFYVTGHGVDESLQERLEVLSAKFFALPQADRLAIRMERGGRAWRGYFPVGNEMTSGRPDLKEGIYFGAELGDEHPGVRAGRPFHGRNLFPDQVPELREVVLAYLEAMTKLGHQLMRGLSLSLGLDAEFFAANYTRDPLVLFRIFHYPAAGAGASAAQSGHWGVGEHTDYGVLTILKQDDTGGLEVKSRTGWVAAPPLPGTFVCNIGDMLERMTGGLYRSTPHRVRNTSGRSRLSFPFFFDPNVDARVHRVPLSSDRTVFPADARERWDQEDPQAFVGTYGDYLLRKVGRVFPDLSQEVLSKPE